MQRINWFPDPNITGTFPPGEFFAKTDYPIVNSRKWIRATSTISGKSHVEYTMSDSQIPPAGSYHVHANTYAQNNATKFTVNLRVDGSYRDVLSVPVGEGQTVVVDRTIIIPSGCDRLGIRIDIDSQTVGTIGMMNDILVERADTYDAAVGGGFLASSPATRCRAHRSVRRAGGAR